MECWNRAFEPRAICKDAEICCGFWCLEVEMQMTAKILLMKSVYSFGEEKGSAQGRIWMEEKEKRKYLIISIFKKINSEK